MHRRTFIATAGASALGLVASPTVSASSARRSFRILRDGDDIGRHELDASLTASGFEIAIDVEIAVKVLGITVYRYTLSNRELWRDGALVSFDSRVDDDGDEELARARRVDGRLVVEGSRYSGDAPVGAATTSYYTPAFLRRSPWISTQSGDLLRVTAAQAGGGWWEISGEMDTRLRYDGRGEWVGCAFDAGGETATYEVIADSGAIADLWSAA